MNTYKRHHFNNVARNMNHYLAGIEHRRHHRAITDQENYLPMNPKPSSAYSSFGGLMESSLRAVGMPTNVVRYGRDFASFFDIFLW